MASSSCSTKIKEPMARHNTGTYMGLQIRDPNGGVDKPVPGYGLQFDTYQYFGCDPLEENYVAIIEDVICSSAKVYRPFANVDDNPWHAFEFTNTNRHIECTLDGTIVHGLKTRITPIRRSASAPARAHRFPMRSSTISRSGQRRVALPPIASFLRVLVLSNSSSSSGSSYGFSLT